MIQFRSMNHPNWINSSKIGRLACAIICSIVLTGCGPFAALDTTQNSSISNENITTPTHPPPSQRDAQATPRPTKSPQSSNNAVEPSQDQPEPPNIASSALPDAKDNPQTNLRLPIAARANIREVSSVPIAEPETGEFLEPGILIVGQDISPGLYYGKGQTSEDACRWVRLSAPELETGNFLASNDTVGRFFVEVQESDRALYTTCAVAPVKAMPREGQINTLLVPGTYLLGVDILPGRYVFDASTTSTGRSYCVVRALSGFSNINSTVTSSTSDVVNQEAWHIDAGRFFFVVPRGAAALQTTCYGRKTTEDEEARRPQPLREWRRTPTPPPNDIDTYTQGEYTTDKMPPGVYKVFSDAKSPFCRVIRYRNGEEVSYEVFNGDAYFEVLQGDSKVLLESESCHVAPLSKLAPPEDIQAQTLFPAGMYIVNYDILPGKYRVETAYLQRDECALSIRANMAHSFYSKGEVNGTYVFRHGEYFVEIKPNDAGIVSTCVLERVE